MKLKIAQVVGLNTDQKAAQVISSTREDQTFLAVLEVSCDDAFTKGRQILSSLEDFYFDYEANIAEKLNATFAEVEKKFLNEDKYSLVLAIISAKVLYLIGKGEVVVYLKRENKLSSLLSVGAPSQLVSGFLQEGDRLLFSTTNLSTFLGSDLEKTLNISIDSFEEEVGGKIGASDLEDQGLAALSVEVEQENLEIDPVSVSKAEQDAAKDYPVQPKTLIYKTILGKSVKLIGLLRTYFPKSGRGRLILAALLIVIIAAGVGYKYKQTQDQQRQMQFSQKLQEGKDEFNAAKGLASLNPADAKSRIESAKDKVNQALALKPKDSDALKLKEQIEQEMPTILQESSVSEFPVFLDLDLIKKGFQASLMSLSKDKLLLLDSSTKTLVIVDISKKSNQILAGEEKLGKAALASLNGTSAFVYSEDKGISKVDTSNSKISAVAKKDSSLGEIKDIYGFAGNVYVLDTGNPERAEGQIWKYLPTPDGYSAAREYLNKEVKADFGGALRMQIESSIYILKSGGEILRFTKGDKDNFSYSGLPSGVKDPKSIFVSSDTEDLYILDSGNSRLLILTKTGAFKGQINGGKFAQASDLVVDETGKKVYLLEGSKIYTADLK